MSIITWPYPDAAPRLPGQPPRSAAPTAMIAILLQKGGHEALAACLAEIAGHGALDGVGIPGGRPAILILARDEAALPVVEAMAEDYPFALQFRLGQAEDRRATRLAEGWAESLGAPGIPVLLTRLPPRRH